MPLPKRRHSSARQAKRRTHYKLHLTGLSECPRCHAARPPHHICTSCGYYNGRQWVAPKRQVGAEA
jgi:large subunit ribosomal protein L32